MAKIPGFDPNALIEMFSGASAKQGEQLRQAVAQATLQALQGRELSLKNIRTALKTVTEAASAGAMKNVMPGVDVESLLDSAVAGMDDALLKAVDANRVALQQFVSQGADLREKHLKKALDDLDKMEDTFIASLKKASDDAASPLAGAWAQVLGKLQAGGTMSGQQAATTAEQFTNQIQQMQQTFREGRAASLRAAQALAESYTALVSGVLIGMSDALQQGGSAGKAKKK